MHRLGPLLVALVLLTSCVPPEVYLRTPEPVNVVVYEQEWNQRSEALTTKSDGLARRLSQGTEPAEAIAVAVVDECTPELEAAVDALQAYKLAKRGNREGSYDRALRKRPLLVQFVSDHVHRRAVNVVVMARSDPSVQSAGGTLLTVKEVDEELVLRAVPAYPVPRSDPTR